MKKIRFLLTGIFVLLVSGAAVAEIFDERFVGIWVLETAELHETPFNNLQEETITVYTMENIHEFSYVDAVVEMSFAEIKPEENFDAEENPATADVIDESEINSAGEAEEVVLEYITTLFRKYENPTAQLVNGYLEFSDSSMDGLEMERYEYLFDDSGKLMLQSIPFFYSKEEKQPVKAQLYMILSKVLN